MTFKIFNWLNERLGVKGESVTLCSELTKAHRQSESDNSVNTVRSFQPNDEISEIDSFIKLIVRTYLTGFYNFWIEDKSGERITVFDGDDWNEKYKNGGNQ